MKRKVTCGRAGPAAACSPSKKPSSYLHAAAQNNLRANFSGLKLNSQHGMKRKVTCGRAGPAAACGPPEKPSSYPHAAAQNNFGANFSGLNYQQQQPQPIQSGSSNGQPTFRTQCPYCRARYMYYMEVLHRSLFCQTCYKSFIAFAYDSGAVPQASKMSHPNDPQQRVMQNQGAHKVDQGSRRNFTAENVFTAFTPNAARTSEVATGTKKAKKGGSPSATQDCEEMQRKDESTHKNQSGLAGELKEYNKTVDRREGNRFEASLTTGKKEIEKGFEKRTAFTPNAARTLEVETEKVNDKSGQKQTVESKKSNSGSEEDVVVVENGDVLTGKKFDSQVEQNLRRSGRCKQHVSYKEDLSHEEDVADHPKRAKKGGSPYATQDCEEMRRKDDSAHENQYGAVPQASKMSRPKDPQQRVMQNQGSQKVDQGSQRNFTAENVFTSFTPNAARTSEVGTKNVNGKRGREQKRAKIGGSPFATQDCEEMLRKDKSAHENQSGLAGEAKEDKRPVDHREGNSFEASLPNGKKKIANGFEKKAAKEDDLKKTREAHADGVKINSYTALDDSVSDSSFKETKESRSFTYPAPEFYDFEKDKKEGCFSVGQVWALYDDTSDAMPRFYARIRIVFSSRFKLRITWLEPDPDDENEIEWVSEGLPVSCGKFKIGHSEDAGDRLMFSHLLYWEKRGCTDGYMIFPRKGETWALFKNWNIKWKSDTGTDQKFQYEFVEILADDAEGVGILVAYLTKVEGFGSVFCQMSKDGVDTFLIPPNELFRFSHKVPSFPLTGKEREGVPKGSFELDPASLPGEIFVPNDLKVDDDSGRLNSSCPSSSETVEPTMVSNKNAPPDLNEIPESEFELDGDSGHLNSSCLSSSETVKLTMVSNKNAPPDLNEIPESEFEVDGDSGHLNSSSPSSSETVKPTMVSNKNAPPDLNEIPESEFEVDGDGGHLNSSCLSSSKTVKLTMVSNKNAPPDLNEILESQFKVGGDSGHLNSSYPRFSETVKPMTGSNENPPPNLTPKVYEIPVPEFYNFDADKSWEKFLVGQFWALYSDEDGLPKYYGQIAKIESKSVFTIHVRWLFPSSKNMLKWHDKDMPFCCGNFRIEKGSQAYTCTYSFSHKLKAEPTWRKGEYTILPRKGEIWALYRSWTPKIKCSDLEKWKYDIVQVMEQTDSAVKVRVLEPVDGFKSVFKPQVKEGSNVTVEIPRLTQLKFSHQIPFFELTKERNGSLRGFWELDPAALPGYYFSS